MSLRKMEVAILRFLHDYESSPQERIQSKHAKNKQTKPAYL